MRQASTGGSYEINDMILGVLSMGTSGDVPHFYCVVLTGCGIIDV